MLQIYAGKFVHGQLVSIRVRGCQDWHCDKKGYYYNKTYG